MKFYKLLTKSILCGVMSVIVLSGCHESNSSESSTADPENPKVVAEGIVDTKRIDFVKKGRGRIIKIHKITVKPKEDSPIHHDWEVSETVYNMCWHGDVAKSYDNGVSLCFDKKTESKASENGGEENGKE